MGAQLRRIEPKRATLFILIAALVAAAAVAAGREAGTGRGADAGGAAAQEPGAAPPQNDGGEGESAEDAAPLTLTLTLSALKVCETEREQGTFGGRSYQDDEGNWHFETYSTGWGSVAEVPVTWSVSGGTEPYTLEIDGEARDAEQTYAGANGTATVSCAQQIGETFIEDGRRRYRTRPEIDSGLKTIRATVTDGAGAAAQAPVEMYVILELGGSGDILERGKTYRVFGHLITAPADYDVEVGSVVSVECDSDLPPDVRCESSFGLYLVGTGAQVDLFMSDGAGGRGLAEISEWRRTGR